MPSTSAAAFRPLPCQRTERAHHSGPAWARRRRRAAHGGGGAMAPPTAKPPPCPAPPRAGRYSPTVPDRRATPRRQRPPPPPARMFPRRPAPRRRPAQPTPAELLNPRPRPPLPRPHSAPVARALAAGPASLWMDRAAGHVKSLQSRHPFHVAHVPAAVPATGGAGPFGSPATQRRPAGVAGPGRASLPCGTRDHEGGRDLGRPSGRTCPGHPQSTREA